MFKDFSNDKMFMNRCFNREEALQWKLSTLENMGEELDDWKTSHAHGLTELALWKSLTTESDLPIQHDPYQAFNHSLQNTRKIIWKFAWKYKIEWTRQRYWITISLITLQRNCDEGNIELDKIRQAD